MAKYGEIDFKKIYGKIRRNRFMAKYGEIDLWQNTEK